MKWAEGVLKMFLREALDYQKVCWVCNRPLEPRGILSDRISDAKIVNDDVVFNITIDAWRLSKRSQSYNCKIQIGLNSPTITIDFPDYLPTQNKPKLNSILSNVDLHIINNCKNCDVGYTIELCPDGYYQRYVNLGIIDKYIILRENGIHYIYKHDLINNIANLEVVDVTAKWTTIIEIDIENANYDLGDPNLLNHLKTELLLG